MAASVHFSRIPLMRFHESLARQLLVLSLVAFLFPAAGCGPSMPANQYEDMQKANLEAEDRLRAKGTLDRKSYGPLGSAWVVKLPKATIDDALITDLGRLDRVSEFHIPGATITDAQMQQILQSGPCGSFNKLDVSDTGLTDAGVEGLAGLRWLQEVNVGGTKISDKFLADMASKRRANKDLPNQTRNVAVKK
jgi:hypothetical protein